MSIAGLGVVIASALTSTGAPAAEPPKAFTVADAIELTELVDPYVVYRHVHEPPFKVSPDRRKFAIVTRRGNLSTGFNEYSLALFNVDATLDYVNARPGARRPSPDVLTTFATSGSHHGIDQVMWQGNDQLVFIGRGSDRLGQIYAFKIPTRSLVRLTHHDGDIRGFDAARVSSRLAFTAVVTPDWTSRNAHGYAVSATFIGDLTTTDPRTTAFQEVGFFTAAFGSGAALALDVSPLTAPRGAGGQLTPGCLSISPNGRWVVMLTHVRKVPLHWSRYGFLKTYLDRTVRANGQARESDVANALAELVPQDAAAHRSPWLKQYYLGDTSTGRVHPLLEAPAGPHGWLTTAVWSPDSASVFVGPTYLPLDSADSSEQARRMHVQSIVEVRLPDHTTYRPVFDVAGSPQRAHAERPRASLVQLEILPDGSILSRWRAQGEPATTARRFIRSDDRWTETSNVAASEPRLGLYIAEDLNTPPEIGARDRATGQRRVITDLNPQLREHALGRAKVFEWQDRLHRKFTGGLVLPPGFVAGQRYPVVLQTNGFNPDEFLIDGPMGMSTAYAARALANQDMLVLQMPRPHVASAAGTGAPAYERDGENPTFVAMMEGAIDALDRADLIDRSRIGLLGFSRAGMHVQYALAFSRYAIAAATIAHSVQATPMSYAMWHGVAYPGGMADLEDERLMGTPFWGDGIKQWMERSPAFHLDRIRTPLRLEHLTTNVPEYWDTFVILRRHRRPVEMIHIPDASHVLETPFARYTSQQGNVDWFAFWLKGEEDNEPTKAATYARWRRLRDQHTRPQDELVPRRETLDARDTH